jgi:hypothetical protein
MRPLCLNEAPRPLILTFCAAVASCGKSIASTPTRAPAEAFDNLRVFLKMEMQTRFIPWLVAVSVFVAIFASYVA